MPDLSDLNLKPTYHKGEDDIAYEFYIPCMLRAQSYDRAVGFFSSTIYVLAWQGLKEFVKRGGKIRIICSPILSEEDKQAIDDGYTARGQEDLGKAFKGEIERLLQDATFSKPTRVLASLVALDVINFKIAIPLMKTDVRIKRLFHDKVGIFQDINGNTVVFKGSMNESWTGLSLDGNIESVDVYVSWESGWDKTRISSEIEYFNKLWEDRYPSLYVAEFPKVAKEVFKQVADVNAWEHWVDDILQDISFANFPSADKKKGGRILRTHQINALKAWFQKGRRGILEHATGSGKTFTALSAIRDSLNKGEITLILVPSDLLLKQWEQEVKDTLDDLDPRILLCGGNNTAWRDENRLRPWTKSGQIPRIVISTLQTAVQEDFLKALAQGDHLFIVVDEVHRIGSLENRKILAIQSGPRLGLSATPKRAGDTIGTKLIFEYFEGVIQPPFTLQDAIRAGTLTPYFYYVHKVELSSQEQASWNNITKQIQSLYAMEFSKQVPSIQTAERIKKLLIKRSRIVKNATNKIYTAVSVLEKFYKPGHRWIIYCDSQTQMHLVHQALEKTGIKSLEYYYQMEGDRKQSLKHFEQNGGVIVSIRCLDEGVDIPSVTHALILASSKNPREFIQRRGRVLRKAIDKHLAYVHDALVLPVNIDSKAPDNTSILEIELVRAIIFGRSAENPGVLADLEQIAIDGNLDFERLYQEGYEDDDDNFE